MPQIPTFEAPAGPPIDNAVAHADPQALGAPGRAQEAAGRSLTAAGGAVEQIGEAFQKLQEFNALKYSVSTRADAVAGAHDRLQSGIDTLRQSDSDGSGFAKQQLDQLDQDLAPRLANAPDDLTRARLKLDFANLRDQIGGQANIVEHARQVQSARAGLSADLAATPNRILTNPALAQEEFARVNGAISGYAHAGALNPEEAQTARLHASNQIWSAELLGRAQHEPAGAMADFTGGKYDDRIDFPTRERLQSRLESAAARGINAQLGTPATGASGSGGDNSEIATNNFAGMRNPNVPAGGGPRTNPAGWQHFATPEAGIAAIDSQLQRYYQGQTTGTPLTTLRQIVSTWAPPNENPTEQLIARAVQVTGFGADEQLTLDPPTRAKLIEATIRNEQGGRLPVDPAIISKVTGAAPPAQVADAGAAAPAAGLAAEFAKIDAMGLDPALAAKVKTERRATYDALEADQLRQQRAAEHADTLRVKATEDSIIADAYSGAPKITAEQVAADPALANHPEARLRMIQVVRNAGEAGPAAGPSHIATLDLVKRINLPDGDPQKITDRAPIVDALANNQIRPADYNFALKQFTDLRDAGGETLAKRKAEFIKAVEPKIDKTWLLPTKGQKDAAGALRLYQFQVMLDQRIEDARKAGKNPFDVMPSDDAAVAALIKPYTRTFQQTMNDLDTEQFGASRSEPAGAADLKTQAGIVAAHRAGKITREQATQALIDGGFAAAPPPTAAPAPALQVPLAR